MIRSGAEMDLTECFQLSPDEPGSATNPLNIFPIDGPIVAATSKVSETRDWASLPPDLLIAVAGWLTSLADFSSFRRVCSSWRSNVIPSANTLASQPPLIMLHVENNECESTYWDEEEDQCPILTSFDVVFLDVMNGRFYKSEYSSCWRSFEILNFSHGYLAMVHGNGHILLRHFFTNDKIWLPKTRKPFSEKRIIFSENPSSPQCLFALYSYYGSTVEFCQQGDSNWKTGNLHGVRLVDMLFFQGKFYALFYTGALSNLYQLATIEFNPSFALKLLGVPMNFYRCPSIFTSGDELLLCWNSEIFVWDFGRSRWILKSSIDGGAIFFSSNQVTAFIKPALESWIKPNYKYYYCMDEHLLMHYLAIGSGADDHIEQSFEYPERASEGIQSWCVGRPVWIFPSMCFPVKV